MYLIMDMSVIKTTFQSASLVTLQDHHQQHSTTCFCCFHPQAPSQVSLSHPCTTTSRRKKHFFPVRMIKNWYRRPKEAEESTSLEILKTWQDTALSSLLCMALHRAGCWTTLFALSLDDEGHCKIVAAQIQRFFKNLANISYFGERKSQLFFFF